MCLLRMGHWLDNLDSHSDSSAMLRVRIAVFWILWIAVEGANVDHPRVRGGEICNFQTFNAQCAPNEVVHIEGASYGRMRLGQCVTNDLGYIGCSSDILDIADNRCSGKHACAIDIPDEEMATRKMPSGCLADLIMYLEANYTCKQVLGIQQKQCYNCDHVKVSQPSGRIGSITTRDTGCGSMNCPWLIEAPPGQRVNLSLWNYGWTGAPGRGQSTCQVYATIKDVRRSVVKEICARNQRFAHVFTSETNAVELRVIIDKVTSTLTSESDAASKEFVFQYEFVGCSDLASPGGGWSRRVDDVTEMGCNSTSGRWRLQCRDNVWEGDTRSCPGYGASVHSDEDDESGMPSGLSVVIIVAVAFVVGALILCIGIVMFRRRYVRQQLERAHTYDEAKIETPDPAKNSLYMPPIYSQDPRDMNRLNQTPRKHMSQRREDYTHIWERPLPNPSGTDSSVSCTCPTGSAYGSNAHAQQTPPEYESEYNTLGTTEPVPTHAQSQSRRMVYGNNTMARKECEKVSPDSDIDPRYFQLDPDTMSSGGEI